VAALAIGQTRSAVLGLGLGTLYSLFGMRTTQRISFIAMLAAAGLAVMALPILLPDIGISRGITSFFSAVRSGMELQHDDNFYFRLLRWDKVFEVWRDNPLFGAGFGRPLIPRTLIQGEEEGLFNAGLPHNTYLTILARLGLFGFILIIGAWITSIVLATRSINRSRFSADAFAAGAALITMMGYATFVLFLERPMHAATLWIIAAAACRLSEPETAGTPRMAVAPARSGPFIPALGAIAHARRIAEAKGFR
jgi:O-antigen ligase